MTGSTISPPRGEHASRAPVPDVHVPDAAAGASLVERYRAVRGWTHALCEPLVTEDYVVRSMPDASPVKWHIAHTSWFFETFVLGPHDPGYRPLDVRYAYLFNSYYVQAGERHCRAQRGLVTRPTVADVYAYRAHVDEHLLALLARVERGDGDGARVRELVEIGLHHEQQHQELIATDVKHLFWTNPLRPEYTPAAASPSTTSPAPLRWIPVAEGLYEVGHASGDGFAFDNEAPRHREFLAGCRIASRLVTNGEYLEFIADGGYRRPELWLSAGWDAVRANGWESPLYWERDDDGWRSFTMAGMRALVAAEPVCHVSCFEADAFARWAGARLPTEAEWEVAAAGVPVAGAFAESRRFHPAVAPSAGAAERDESRPAQLYGDLWQWTASQYRPYPGFTPAAGAIGEYNGKFMCDQWVLRGASCATPRSHARRTYRNFFPADARWQFSGLRLAADA